MRQFWKSCAAAAAMALVCAGAALAGPEAPGDAPERRGVAVEDLTALEAFGRGSLSPDGRWAVYEKRGPYRSLPRFEYEWRSAWAGMDLWVADVDRPDRPPERLLPSEGPGLQRLSWSPSGARLLVTRFRNGRLEPGIVEMSGRTVRWTGLTLDVPRTGAQAAWLSDDRALLLVRPAHDLPAALAYQGASPRLLAAAWERTATGREPSRTIVDGEAGVAHTPDDRAASALVVLEAATGGARTLVEGGIADFSPSPDGRRVAILRGEAGASLRADEVVQFESPFRHSLELVEIDTGERVAPLGDREVGPGLLRWSPSSREVLVWARDEGQSWRSGGLVRAGTTGARTPRLDGLAPGTSADISQGVRADWVGNTPIVHARTAAGGRGDWWAVTTEAPPVNLTASLVSAPAILASAGDHSVQLFADGAYWTLDLNGPRRLTPEGLPVTAVVAGDMELATRLRVNEAPRRSWSVTRGDNGEAFVVGEARPDRVGPPSDETGRVLAVSDQGELQVRRTGLSEALVLRSPVGETVIDRINGKLSGVEWSNGQAISHLDKDGLETRSWLFMPPAGVAVRGVLVKVYPDWADEGGWPGSLAMTYGLSPQVFTGAGYSVLSPATPQTGTVTDRGADLVRSVDLAVDAALQAHPELPADRIAVLGHSFGGYAALEIAARSRRYKAYVASSSFSDILGAWGEFEPATRILPADGGMVRAAQGWAETGQARLGGPPWAATNAYLSSSPYLMADRIEDPVLLLAADMDFVPLSQSERMYSAILRTGGRVRLVTYWGEHHNLWSPANIEDRFRLILDWLAMWLEGEPSPVRDAPPIS